MRVVVILLVSLSLASPSRNVAAIFRKCPSEASMEQILMKPCRPSSGLCRARRKVQEVHVSNQDAAASLRTAK